MAHINILRCDSPVSTLHFSQTWLSLSCLVRKRLSTLLRGNQLQLRLHSLKQIPGATHYTQQQVLLIHCPHAIPSNQLLKQTNCQPPGQSLWSNSLMLTGTCGDDKPAHEKLYKPKPMVTRTTQAPSPVHVTTPLLTESGDISYCLCYLVWCYIARRSNSQVVFIC